LHRRHRTAATTTQCHLMLKIMAGQCALTLPAHPCQPQTKRGPMATHHLAWCLLSQTCSPRLDSVDTHLQWGATRQASLATRQTNLLVRRTHHLQEVWLRSRDTRLHLPQTTMPRTWEEAGRIRHLKVESHPCTHRGLPLLVPCPDSHRKEHPPETSFCFRRSTTSSLASAENKAIHP
jgi:hypothetical protein